jgi:preprotein translocase subunit SecD
MNIMKGIIPVTVACLTLLGALASGSASTPFFQIRLVLDAPSERSQQMVYRKEMLYVQKTVLLDETALVSATLVPADARDDRLRIEIVLTDEGKKRFATVTRQSIGKCLAFIVGGKIYYAPKIMAEISSGTFQIFGSFSEREANDLVAQINEMIKEASTKR